MGEAELATDPRFAAHAARGEHMEELDARIGAWTATLTTEELLAVLEEHGVPAGQIYTAKEMITDPHYHARGMVQRIRSEQGWEVPVTGVVPRFSRTAGAIRHAGPALGAQTREVLGEVAGLAAAEIDALAADGLLGLDD